MGNHISALFSTAVLAAFCGTASAYTLTGTVKNDEGQIVEGAKVALLNLNQSATTDNEGKFTIHEDEDGTGIKKAARVGSYSLNNGVLSFSQGSSAPIQVKIFDMMGNQVFNKTLQGNGSIDLSSAVEAQGKYFARIKMGSVQESVRFTASGNYSGSFGMTNSGSALRKEITPGGEPLQVTADGYDTLNVKLMSLDTTVELKLTKATSGEQTYAFGYALKNAPTPSKGCGTNSTLQEIATKSGAKNYKMTSAGLNRDFWVSLPQNYDNKKPYKILFAMHCMGSNAEEFATMSGNQDHPSPYYGQQKLDKDNEFIFVSPHGDTDFMPWRTGDDKDHIFFGELLTLLEENYCIDTSRVFVTGFSFGAMVTNSLAQDFQDRIRAVAVYATADYNIYLPKNKGKPIAWMAVHGKNDGTCDYSRAKNSALKRILKNNGKADADGNFTDASSETPQEVGGSGHLCYDFKTVDERFPVKFCSWNGPHQWTAFDNGNWQNTWVPEEVHKFFGQF
jgi:poly(3-hydroxybutyrate) depolymerase